MKWNIGHIVCRSVNQWRDIHCGALFTFLHHSGKIFFIIQTVVQRKDVFVHLKPFHSTRPSIRPPLLTSIQINQIVSTEKNKMELKAPNRFLTTLTNCFFQLNLWPYNWVASSSIQHDFMLFSLYHLSFCFMINVPITFLICLLSADCSACCFMNEGDTMLRIVRRSHCAILCWNNPLKIKPWILFRTTSAIT